MPQTNWPTEGDVWPLSQDAFDASVVSEAPDGWDTWTWSTNDLQLPNPTFHYTDIPPEMVKILLPEVYHPHSQETCTVYGIPFPVSIRNVIVLPQSEVDAWNQYYFAEDPDVNPYPAGLTCVPDLAPAIPY